MSVKQWLQMNQGSPWKKQWFIVVSDITPGCKLYFALSRTWLALAMLYVKTVAIYFSFLYPYHRGNCPNLSSFPYWDESWKIAKSGINKVFSILRFCTQDLFYYVCAPSLGTMMLIYVKALRNWKWISFRLLIFRLLFFRSIL